MGKVDTTVSQLVAMIERGELKLPEMQRSYVWPATRVRDLLDSLYRKYPSGSILVWESEDAVPTRELAIESAQNAFSTHKMLLDGQQRLTSLAAMLTGKPVTVRRRKKPIEILFNLDHPDGPPVELTEVDDDPDLLDDDDGEGDDMVGEGSEGTIKDQISKRTFVVASRTLKADTKWVNVAEVLKGDVSDWTILKRIGLLPDDSRFERYSMRLQKLRAIRDYPYVMYVLERELSYEEVTEIFVRVNSLGMKLRGSDLALAQITARWKGSLALFEAFAEDIADKSYFMLDVGLLVKAIVIFASHQSRFKTLQGISVGRLEEGWKQAKDGIRFAVNLLSSNLGIEEQSLLSSPFIILTVAAYAVQNDQEFTAEQLQQLRQWILLASARGRYSHSSESMLDQDLAVVFKDRPIADLVERLKQQVGRLHVEPADFAGRGTRNSLFPMTYLALKRAGAQDWVSGLTLSLTHQGKLHFIEHHHIFPKSVLAKAGVEDADINEIANFAFISGKANRRLFTRPPAEYLPDVIATFGEDALIRHCLPIDPELWKTENYLQFLEWRRERLSDEVNVMMGVSPT